MTDQRNKFERVCAAAGITPEQLAAALREMREVKAEHALWADELIDELLREAGE